MFQNEIEILVGTKERNWKLKIARSTNSKQSIKLWSITVSACTWNEPQFKLFILLQIDNTEWINSKSNHSLALEFHLVFLLWTMLWALSTGLVWKSIYLFSCTQIPITVLWFVIQMDRMEAIYHNGWNAFCILFLYFFDSGLTSF